MTDFGERPIEQGPDAGLAALALQQGEPMRWADFGPTPGKTCSAFIISSEQGLNFMGISFKAAPKE
jgi:hypothetical protein